MKIFNQPSAYPDQPATILCVLHGISQTDIVCVLYFVHIHQIV